MSHPDIFTAANVPVVVHIAPILLTLPTEKLEDSGNAGSESPSRHHLLLHVLRPGQGWLFIRPVSRAYVLDSLVQGTVLELALIMGEVFRL